MQIQPRNRCPRSQQHRQLQLCVPLVAVDDVTYRDWAERGRFVTMDGTEVTDARTLAGQIGLAKAMRRYDLHRTITFHSRVT